MLSLNWEEIKALEDGPALASFPVPYTIVTKTPEDRWHGGACQFSEHEFATYHRDIRDPGWPNVIRSFVWASSVECVKGLLLGSPGSEEIPRITPPDEVLAIRGCVRYEEVRKAVESGKHDRFSIWNGSLKPSLFEQTSVVTFARHRYYFCAPFEDWTGQIPVLVEFIPQKPSEFQKSLEPRLMG